MRQQHKLYFTIFLGIAIILIFILFSFLFGFLYFDSSFLTSINDQEYLKVLISIVGLLIAFSAISIYSSFHTNIDNEKEHISRILVEYEKKYEILEKTTVKIEQTSEKIKELGLNNYVTTIDFQNIMILTSDFTRKSDKLEAIAYLNNKSRLDDSLLYTIINYHNHISALKKFDKEIIDDIDSLISKHKSI